MRIAQNFRKFTNGTVAVTCVTGSLLLEKPVYSQTWQAYVDRVMKDSQVRSYLEKIRNIWKTDSGFRSQMDPQYRAACLRFRNQIARGGKRASTESGEKLVVDWEMGNKAAVAGHLFTYAKVTERCPDVK